MTPVRATRVRHFNGPGPAMEAKARRNRSKSTNGRSDSHACHSVAVVENHPNVLLSHCGQRPRARVGDDGYAGTGTAGARKTAYHTSPFGAELALQALDAEDGNTAMGLYLHARVAERRGQRIAAQKYYRNAEAVLLTRSDAPDVRKMGTGVDEFLHAIRYSIRRLEAAR